VNIDTVVTERNGDASTRQSHKQLLLEFPGIDQCSVSVYLDTPPQIDITFTGTDAEFKKFLKIFASEIEKVVS